MTKYSSSAKRHLVVVAPSIEPGGGVANAARAQVLALSDSFFISLIRSEGNIDKPTINLVDAPMPKLYFLRRFGHVAREVLFCQRVSKTLLVLHEERAIDFVIFHSHSAAAIAGRKFKTRTGIGFGIVTHGDIFSRPPGTYDPLLTRLYRWASRKSYRASALIVALSPFMRDAAINHGALADNVCLIPNGVDLPAASQTRPRERTRLELHIKFLSLGRLAVEKDLATLIDGFAIAASRNNQLRLTIAGDGSTMADCINQVERLGLQNKVEFVGQLNRQQVLDCYQQHDIFCITSISDPLPTVVLEAMHFGLPVIGTAVDGIPFMVQPGETGVLVPAQNASNLAEAMVKLAADSQLRLNMAQKARTRVQSTFSWPVVAKQLEEAINSRIA